MNLLPLVLKDREKSEEGKTVALVSVGSEGIDPPMSPWFILLHGWKKGNITLVSVGLATSEICTENSVAF